MTPQGKAAAGWIIQRICEARYQYVKLRVRFQTHIYMDSKETWRLKKDPSCLNTVSTIAHRSSQCCYGITVSLHAYIWLCTWYICATPDYIKLWYHYHDHRGNNTFFSLLQASVLCLISVPLMCVILDVAAECVNLWWYGYGQQLSYSNNSKLTGH